MDGGWRTRFAGLSGSATPIARGGLSAGALFVLFSSTQASLCREPPSCPSRWDQQIR